MRQSKLFTKTLREDPKDEASINARLLVRAGFIDKLSAGVYTYLPLGLRILKKIQDVIREEMNALGAQEVLMPALHPKEPWEKTGRWTDPGQEVMFRVQGREHKEYGLGWTHEEVITPLIGRFVQSYEDLPIAAYQIQDKFRNEPRAKSGLLRGREFSMKDMYSFHRDEADLQAFYGRAIDAYKKVFARCGLNAIVTEASGGAFSKYSHEFQVPTPYGEDTIFACEACHYAQNKEITTMKEGSQCPKCKGPIREAKAIEVGNIFQLKTRFTQAFSVQFSDETGKKKPVLMGCYGIGPSRVMGAIAEVHHDAGGLIFPPSVAPFTVHLLTLGEDEAFASHAGEVYDTLSAARIEVLWDDRKVSAGVKLKDADLLGMPVRVVIGKKAQEQGGAEVKARWREESEMISKETLAGRVKFLLQQFPITKGQ